MLKTNETESHSDLNRKLNVAHINVCTETEGPYRRMAIWFQGCDILCKGCCNPELQPIKAAHFLSVREIVDIAMRSKAENGIEGITFLGGEPTLQKNLGVLARTLRSHELGIVLFTGKEYRMLSEELVNSVDLIVDGKFDLQQMDDERNLIGSKNQKIYFVTDRYKREVSWFANSREKKIEINMGEDSSYFMSGDVT